MEKVIRDEPFTTDEGIIASQRGRRPYAANIELSALEMSWFNAMSRDLPIAGPMSMKPRSTYDVVSH